MRFNPTPQYFKERKLKYILSFFLMIFSSMSFAGFCTMQLQEEANVFDVTCDLNLQFCIVTGYLTHPKLIPGYKGMVGFLQTAQNKQKEKNSILLIQTYRNGKTRVKTPAGYFSAMAAAERIMLGEQLNQSLYFDAQTGNRTGEPELECIKTKQSNK